MDRDQLLRNAFVPHSAPLEIVRAEGAYLYTADGRQILDAGGGAIVTNIGHGRKEVAEAYAKAVEAITYVVPSWMTKYKAALIERLVANWLPKGLTRCFFTSGGSEAVEAALRLARAHHVAAGRPERWKIIGLDLSYHGVSLGALGVGYHAGRRAAFEPMLPAFPHAPNPYDHENAAAQLEAVIQAEGPESVAAFIAEPIVGAAGGAMVPPPEYWPRVREICDRYGILMIADEVMTGFGRTGKRFAMDHWGVTPDILVGGKGLAGGYAPIGGIFTSDAVVAPLAERREDLMFYTFSGHPASCAAAEKVLEIMEREQLVDRAAAMGVELQMTLMPLASHPNVLEVRGLGLMQGLELVRDRTTGETFPPARRFAASVTAAGLERGAWLYPCGSGAHPDCILLGPPLTITGDEVAVIGQVLFESIEAALG